jgi:hypothetical protein
MKPTKKKNGKRPKQKWKMNQSTKINLIGCDTIVNSPSYTLVVSVLATTEVCLTLAECQHYPFTFYLYGL